MTEEFLKYSSAITAVIGIAAALTSLYSQRLYEKFNRKKKATVKNYSELLKTINRTFFEIHDERKKLTSNSVNEMLGLLQIITDKFKLAFDQITESDCRITTKVFVVDQKEIVIRTLTRDSYSKPNNNLYDKSFKQGLYDDTAAATIFSGSTYFLENDISRFASEFKNQNKFNRLEKAWGYPYLSSLVVPVKQESDGSDNIIGLLCIDSNRRNAFDKSIDVHLAEGLADGMSQILIGIREGITKNTV
ncbi:hypothetical protein BH11BAC3_BH11BAC3_23620 [soil metagenome]